MRLRQFLPLLLVCSLGQLNLGCAQDQPPRPGQPEGGPANPGGFGGPGFGGPGGPGGFGGFGPNRQTMKVLEKFDGNKDGWLNSEERIPARKHVVEQKSQM